MDYKVDVFRIFASDWALLTAGTIRRYNTMTIGWGGLGTLWRRPAVTVYVKPVRYTHEFMDANEYFTVSFYGPEHRRALSLLGSKSGRDCDKVAEAGLTPVEIGNAVTFKEARSTILCKKMYRQDLDASLMPPDVVADFYTPEAPHTMYVGEVVRVL